MGQLSDLGVTVVDVPDKSEWVEAVQPVYEKFGTPKFWRFLRKFRRSSNYS